MDTANGDEPRPLPPARPRVRRRRPAEAAPVAFPPPQAVQPPTASRSFDVGYCKPPKHAQFQKGVSGNPRGRPKGAKGLNTIVREQLTEKVEVRTAAGTRKVSKMEALMLRSIELALKGNVRMAALLWAHYATAVPETAARADAPGAEDLTATDLAMLDALRESFGGLDHFAASDEPQTAKDVRPNAASEPNGEATVPDQTPIEAPKRDEAPDYDWDRKLV